MNGIIKVISAQPASSFGAYISLLTLATLPVWLGAVASLRAGQSTSASQSKKGLPLRPGGKQEEETCSARQHSRQASLKEDLLLIPVIGIAVLTCTTWHLGRVDRTWLKSYLDIGFSVFATAVIFKAALSVAATLMGIDRWERSRWLTVRLGTSSHRHQTDSEDISTEPASERSHVNGGNEAGAICTLRLSLWHLLLLLVAIIPAAVHHRTQHWAASNTIALALAIYLIENLRSNSFTANVVFSAAFISLQVVGFLSSTFPDMDLLWSEFTGELSGAPFTISVPLDRAHYTAGKIRYFQYESSPLHEPREIDCTSTPQQCVRPLMILSIAHLVMSGWIIALALRFDRNPCVRERSKARASLAKSRDVGYFDGALYSYMASLAVTLALRHFGLGEVQNLPSFTALSMVLYAACRHGELKMFVRFVLGSSGEEATERVDADAGSSSVDTLPPQSSEPGQDVEGLRRPCAPSVKRLTRSLGGHITDVLIQEHPDRTLVLVTQQKGLSSMVEVSSAPAADAVGDVASAPQDARTSSSLRQKSLLGPSSSPSAFDSGCAASIFRLLRDLSLEMDPRPATVGLGVQSLHPGPSADADPHAQESENAAQRVVLRLVEECYVQPEGVSTANATVAPDKGESIPKKPLQPLPSSKSASPSEDTLRQGLTMARSLLTLPLSWLSLTPTSLVLATLALGPLPKHVAFIMDGNRRWARSLPQSEKTISGHQSGFEALKRVLDLCLKLGGVEHVTVYAFAIDNFKRKKGEVDELMGLARQSLIELAGHGELLARHKARLRVIGRVHLLPKDVQDAVRRVEGMTRENTGPTLNICIPYSSRDEIAGAVQSRVRSQLEGGASASDCASPEEEVDLLGKEMLLAHSPPVDIMVRTSGVHRLSDFMLWQITPETTMHFVPAFWPVFGLRDMLPILLQWQAHQFRKWLVGSAG